MQLSTISQWGNSLALRIPKEVLAQTELKVGDKMSVDVKNGIILFKKQFTPKKYQLKDILGSIQTTKEVPELDWGNAEGKEIW